MKIKTAAGRLERAGTEYRACLTKMQRAVDALAQHLMDVLPNQRTSLPGGYTFQYWTSGYRFTDEQGPNPRLSLSDQEKPLVALLSFTHDIEEGWLHKVAEYLEQEAAKVRGAAAEIDAFLVAQ